MRGLRQKQKRQRIFHYLQHKVNKEGIFFIQEAHSTKDDEEEWIADWGGDLLFSHGTSQSTGVIIAFNKKFNHKIGKITRDENGRVLIVDFSTDTRNYTCINFYNSNLESEQVQSIATLNDLIDLHNADHDRHYILAGDMNLFFDTCLDTLGGNPSLKNKSLSALINLLEKLDVCDIFRIRNPSNKRFTFRQKNRNNTIIHRRLDYIFLSNSLQEFARKTDTLPSILSDHSPVLLSLNEDKDTARGKNIWKFNNGLLLFDSFQDGVNTTIHNTIIENQGSNPHLLWEIIKYEVRKFSIKFSKNRSKTNNIDKKKHEDIVNNFETNPNSNISENDYDTSKNWLENWYADYTKGAILRSKAEWYEMGEKSTKFFLNLEKRNSIKNTIRNIFIKDSNNNDILCDDEGKILNHAKNFYENLFCRKSEKSFDACSDFLNQVDTPKLSSTQKTSCDQPLEISELSSSLESMPCNKSPGNDGLTVEFYRKFWPLLKDPLFNSVMYSKEHGFLSSSQRQAVIKLLEKKDKDKRYIENWRPISLLNVDTKIISKALAARIKVVLPHIISHDQTAYVNGRFIGESTRLISDILDTTDRFNIGGYILTADIEKAFDSMDHIFLIACLKKYGFGDYFCDWIKILLNKNESCVLNGGTTSKYFLLNRGARQGDPIAAYLFIICLEIFFIMARSDNNIKPLSVCNYSFLLSAYADDTTFFVKDLSSIIFILKLFDNFSNFSGFKLNKSKCEVCGIGSLKGVHTALCEVKNVNLVISSIKVLGFHFSYNRQLRDDKNFISVIKKIVTVLNIWRMRQLTLSGKIIIFKSLAISKIVYISHILPVSDSILDHLNTIHKKFIWDNKRAKIKHSTLIASYEQGGLKDIDIFTKIKALQLSWIKRLLDDNFHPWKVIPTYIFTKISPLGSNIFYPNFMLDIDVKNIPDFYQNILNFWTEFSHASPLTASSVLSECVWNNRHITIGNKVIQPTFLSAKNVIFVADFFDVNGNVIPWLVFKLNNDLSEAKHFNWIQIIDAIPADWKNIVKIDNGRSRQFCLFNPHLIYKARMLPCSRLSSRELYNIRLSKIVGTPTSQLHIQKLLNAPSLPWKSIYLLARSISIDSYSRVFQYKCLNSILYLNLALYKMGLSDTPLCSFCHSDNETISHLFYSCNISTSVWSDIQAFFSSKIALPTLTLQSAVLGFFETDHDNSIFFNNILLMYKITLYRNREKGSVTSNNVIKNLKNRENIEKSIAARNANTLQKHSVKWRILNSFFDAVG